MHALPPQMEGVKAAAANDRADVGDYVAAVDKALDTCVCSPTRFGFLASRSL